MARFVIALVVVEGNLSCFLSSASSSSSSALAMSCSVACSHLVSFANSIVALTTSMLVKSVTFRKKALFKSGAETII